jgi:hypothetical protein
LNFGLDSALELRRIRGWVASILCDEGTVIRITDWSLLMMTTCNGARQVGEDEESLTALIGEGS